MSSPGSATCWPCASGQETYFHFLSFPIYFLGIIIERLWNCTGRKAHVWGASLTSTHIVKLIHIYQHPYTGEGKVLFPKEPEVWAVFSKVSRIEPVQGGWGSAGGGRKAMLSPRMGWDVWSSTTACTAWGLRLAGEAERWVGATWRPTCPSHTDCPTMARRPKCWQKRQTLLKHQ